MLEHKMDDRVEQRQDWDMPAVGGALGEEMEKPITSPASLALLLCDFRFGTFNEGAICELDM